MHKLFIGLFLLLFVIFLAACGVPTASPSTTAPAASPTPNLPTPTPEPTHTPTPEPTDTPTPLPTNTPTLQPTPTANHQAESRIEEVDEGFRFTDEARGYAFLLPGKDWIPFIPGQDDLNAIFESAAEVMPNADLDHIRQLAENANAEFSLFAFSVAKEANSEDFISNLNVNAIPLDKSYSIAFIIAANKAQLMQHFPDASIQSASSLTNEQGVDVGILSIRNEIVLPSGPFPLIQTFIFFQTPDRDLITITASFPWEKRELLDLIIEQIAHSIAFIP